MIPLFSVNVQIIKTVSIKIGIFYRDQEVRLNDGRKWGLYYKFKSTLFVFLSKIDIRQL